MYAVDGGRKKQALPVAAPVWGLLWNYPSSEKYLMVRTIWLV